MQENIFPSVASEIIDNSFATIVESGTTETFAVIISEKGRDNVIQHFSANPDAFVEEYGDPSLKKYGQINHNIANWLTAGGGVYVLSVKGDDARFAHSIISMGAKKDIAGGKNELIMKPTATQLATGLSSVSGLLTGMKAIPATDAEGYKTFPLFGFVPNGRCSAYNNLALSISANDNLDATYKDFRLLDISVVEISNGTTSVVEGPFTVSLEPDAIAENRSPLFIEKVFKRYCTLGSIVFNEDGYEALGKELGIDPALINLTSAALQDYTGAPDFYADAGYTATKWAVTTGTANNKTTDTKFVDFTSVVKLAGGLDGDLSLTAQTQLKVKGYKGIIDSNVMDKSLYPIDVLLDANEDFAVKSAMGQYTLSRQDHVAILDCGITGSPAEAIALRDAELSFDSCYISIFAQDFEVYDEYSGTQQRMTVTYDLASKIPSHDTQYGIHRPFVGPRRGGVGSHTNLSWLPTDAQKTSLYKRQVNYIERSPKRLNYATQLTSQTATSKLSDLSIVRVVLAIRRRAMIIADDFRMEFINDATLGDLQRQIFDGISEYVTNGACESIDVVATSSDYDKTQKRARVAIGITPTSIMERIAISINVNK